MTDQTPRVGDQITTAEQRDSLPNRTALHDSDGDLWERHGSVVDRGDLEYSAWLGTTTGICHGVDMPLPATVLYVPGEPSRLSVTDNARAEADRKAREEHWCGDPAVFVAGAEWAAGRAETTTATTEDARMCEFCIERPATAITPGDEYGICDDCSLPQTTRDKIITALDHEGAFCGDCGREPGDPLDDCDDCRRCLNRYADALLPLLATARTRPTETEWGVRWRPGWYEAAPDEDAARIWATADTGHPVAFVRREVTAWTEADR